MTTRNFRSRDAAEWRTYGSTCCEPSTTARITAIAAIVGFTSAGGTEGISAAIWPSSFGFGACSLFELPS